MIAVIREAECIGCAKCIQACPVDAILGSARKTHTVIQDECISCKLCLPPCPVDCIDWVALEVEREEKAGYVKQRVAARRKRLGEVGVVEDERAHIQEALMRVRARKSSV